MKKLFKDQLEIARNIENKSERLTFLTSILRSLLQSSVVVTFEITKALTPSDDVALSEHTDRFCKPTDGIPLQILDALTAVIRGYFSKDFLMGWFESTSQVSIPLSRQLVEWVEFRNKRPAHGVLDKKITNEWASTTESILVDCLSVFSKILPTINNSNTLNSLDKFENILIETPIISNGSPIVIISVRVKKGIWKINGQLLSKNNAKEFTIELPENNIFNSTGLKSIGRYELTEIVSKNKTYSFFHNIPVRQTDTFEGRKKELGRLKEWVDDEDSRYCLVFGDGGYGKTTLVLEMLNQFLESQLDFNEPLPTVISYHTAKSTRWTEEGLVHLTGISPIMDECVRDLMRFFDPILKKDWYTVSGRQLINKAVGVLQENKLSRDDILLVIDNTETLATTIEEVRDLGEFLKILGKFVGRVIITSRRREFIEATPIVIEGLSENEGMNLMKRLAKDFRAIPILQAGEPRLRRVSMQLMHKPILLEALVKYIARSDLGIDVAIENLFKKTSEDLLEFLYEDAWARMNQLQKEVFFVLVNISSPIDQNSVGRMCLEVGIQNTEFQSSLEETHFAILTDYGRTFTIELVDLARRFFLQQFGKIDPSDKERIQSLAVKIDQYSAEREKVEKEYKTDRIAEAFRSEYARSAKVYADKGDVENAVEMYELAIEDDPVNSSLHDRFSWLLLNKANKFEYAKRMSEKAFELDPSNCDAIVGLALACYRLKDINEGDKYIDEAERKGRSQSFCLLRKAIARYHKARDIEVIDSQIACLEDASRILDLAVRRNLGNHGYDAKNSKDIQRYQDLTRKKLTIARAKRTKNSSLSRSKKG
ncbi:tetratricopeptide repeat protein [Amphritea sp.]|uniref:tetratricopeptide repeat protein n=1 Tax=Amphritea sp. TaxID=1872502 RepID=UPI003A90C578